MDLLLSEQPLVLADIVAQLSARDALRLAAACRWLRRAVLPLVDGRPVRALAAAQGPALRLAEEATVALADRRLRRHAAVRVGPGNTPTLHLCTHYSLVELPLECWAPYGSRYGVFNYYSISLRLWPQSQYYFKQDCKALRIYYGFTLSAPEESDVETTAWRDALGEYRHEGVVACEYQHDGGYKGNYVLTEASKVLAVPRGVAGVLVRVEYELHRQEARSSPALFVRLAEDAGGVLQAVEELTNSLRMLAVAIVASPLCFVLAFAAALALRSRLPPLARRFLLVALAAQLAVLAAVTDDGGTLERHGSFALAGFVTFFCAAAAAVAAVAALAVLAAVTDDGGTLERHGSFALAGFVTFFCAAAAAVAAVAAVRWALPAPRHRALVCLCCLALASAAFCVLTARSRASWPAGLAGRRVSASVGCAFDAPAWEAMALWPAFLLRLVTDKPCAGAGSRVPAAALDARGLRAGCAARVTAFPGDLASAPPSAGLDSRSFPGTVLARAASLRYATPGALLALPADATAALVECDGGGPRELLTRPRRDERAVAAAAEALRRAGNGTGLDVLVVFVDALSRRLLPSLLPRTARALEGTRTHEVFQFFRYHAVSQITGRNFYALWGRGPGGLSMWELARGSGYVSAYVTEQCEWKDHFDIRGRPDYWPLGPFCLPEYQPPHDDSLPMLGPYSFARRCIAGREVHKHAMALLSEWWGAHAGSRRLAWGVFMEAHEPSTNVVRQIDAELAQLVAGQTMDLSRAAVFLVSDHGPHGDLGFVLNQRAAMVDNSLPNFELLLPVGFLDSHPRVREALRSNEEALLTARDIRETIAHVLAGAWPNRATAEASRAHSLFNALPARTCREADVPLRLCVCKSG
eukprot:m51a1_g5318 hypothetical protein (869) ;mRNA; f:316471-321407